MAKVLTPSPVARAHSPRRIDLCMPKSVLSTSLGPLYAKMQAAFPTAAQLDGAVYCLRPQLPLGGRLSAFLPFWEEITSDQWVLSVIRNGYSLELITCPPRTGVRLTILRDGGSVLLDEVAELCAKSAVQELPPGPRARRGYYSTYFLVPKKDGGMRPILNLKPFNRCLRKHRFKMETLNSILSIVQPGVWLASLDLKDAYFHVPIARAHWKYLRFAIDGRLYQYKVTPFGLSLAPMLFTRVVLAVVGWLRVNGIHLHAYLDDLLILAPNPSELRHAVLMTIQAFTWAGFTINLKKSDLHPTQDLVYIGGRFRTWALSSSRQTGGRLWSRPSGRSAGWELTIAFAHGCRY